MNTNERLHSLDGLRALALLLGVALHGAMSFIPGIFPGIWATVDNAPTAVLGGFFFVTHVFRMALFFVIAGFFARLLVERKGVAAFWSNRLVRIGVPLVVGWCLVYPAIAAVWGWGMKLYFNGNVPELPAAMRQPPAGFFPLAHLWFLYYLVMLYAVAMAARTVLRRVDAGRRVAAFVDRALRMGIASGAAPLVLALPVATVLYFLPRWIAFSGVPTPDMTLIPQYPSLVAYGLAMGVGWALHRQKDSLLGLLARRWLPSLLIGTTAVVVAMQIVGTRIGFAPLPMGLRRAMMAYAYCVGTWGFVLGLMGVALRFFANESRVRRYVADASYWMYIVHLPVVAAFGVVVAKWNLHWTLKYGFVLAASLTVLLTSYHLLVRSTFVGQVLNGRRVPFFRRRTGAVASVRPANDANVAELQQVCKRYGKRLALDGVNLQLRRGELLALLGPNGAGKSTAIGLWLGLHQADAGAVTLAGGSPLDVACRRSMGVMMQDVSLANGMRVRELIAQAASYYVNPRSVAETLKLARIEPLAGRMYDKLSGGQKRQVQFALAICGRPRVLFLDEPSVGLDIQARGAMWETIRALLREGCSILLTTHYLEEAEALADRVVVLAQGRVVASGSVDQIRSLVSRREIRCESNVPLETMRAWPGVLDVAREARCVKLTVVDAESILRRLFAADADVARLEVRQAGLAEAFTHLTKEAA